MKIKKIVIGVSISLVVVFFGLALSSQNSEILLVKTIKAEQGPLSSIVRATGRVMSARDAQLSASAAGQIVHVSVQEGKVVAKKTLLISLDGRDDETRQMNADAALREAQEKVEQTKRTAEGLRHIYEAGGASLQSLQDAESQREIAIAGLARAKAEMKAAEISIGKLKITAPFAGIITKISARVGEWAVPGTPLITIADTKEREIHVFVDESDAGLITASQKVDVSCDAFPGTVWSERVIRIDPAVQKEGTANAVTVHASLQSDSQRLRLGQQVDVRIQTAHRDNAVKLPFEVLITEDGKTFVAMIADGKVQLKPVGTDIEDMSHVEITEGVQPGNEIILPEGRKLREGQRVRMVQEPKR